MEKPDGEDRRPRWPRWVRWICVIVLGAAAQTLIDDVKREIRDLLRRLFGEADQ